MGWGRTLLKYLRFSSMSAPRSTEVDRFLALAFASGLVDQDGLRDACSDFHVDRTKEGTVDSLCRHLIAKATLTEWQCDKLRKGKWKGFWMDKYCLLSQLGKSETTSTYLAKEWPSGRLVAVVITPPRLTPDGQLTYRVEELSDQH